MFRTPQVGDPKKHLHDEQYEYSAAYLCRNRRMLFLRGIMLGVPNRTDSYSPMGVSDDILALNVQDPTKPIYLFIDSPGGDISAGMILYDTIKLSRAPIITIGGSCSSMAVSILASGSERLVYPHSRIMLHLLQAELSGDADEIKIRSDMLQKLKEDLVDCYIDCGATAGIIRRNDEKPSRIQIRNKILKDIDKEFWLDSQGAIDYGLADRMVTQEDIFGNDENPSHNK